MKGLRYARSQRNCQFEGSAMERTRARTRYNCRSPSPTLTVARTYIDSRRQLSTHRVTNYRGARTLIHERAIMDMGARRIVFPGPGELRMELPPGSVVIPLEQAPSGHLVMPIDEYSKVTKATGGTPSSSLSLISMDAPMPPPTTLTSGSSSQSSSAPVVLRLDEHLNAEAKATPTEAPPGLAPAAEARLGPMGRDLQC